MKKPTLFPAVGLLLGVVLAWSALAPGAPYSGTLAATGGGDYCLGVTTVYCKVLSPECEGEYTFIERCYGYTTSGYTCGDYDAGDWNHPICRAHCSWQYCPSDRWQYCE